MICIPACCAMRNSSLSMHILQTEIHVASVLALRAASMASGSLSSLHSTVVSCAKSPTLLNSTRAHSSSSSSRQRQPSCSTAATLGPMMKASRSERELVLQ